jgi:transcriptional antiterminator RfaH
LAIYWYVLRSKPNREEFLEGQLLSRNYEVFYPRLRVKPVNPRSRKQKPYFPGYLFLHTDLDSSSVSSLERIPGVTNLVSFGGEPSNVPDWVIHEIRMKVDELNAHSGDVKTKFPAGALVKIDHGPFAGYEGIVDERIPGRERVRILLKMLQDRNIPVDLPITDVSLKKGNKPSQLP